MTVLTPANLSLLDQWRAAKAASEAATLREQELRGQVIEAFYPGINNADGTKNVDLTPEWYLSANFKKNYKLANGQGETAIVHKNLPSALRDRVIKWDPKLAVGEYKKLDPAHRDLVNTVLTITDGRPSIEIKPVKA